MLTEDHSNAAFQIQSISPGKIIINKKPYENSVLISADKLISPWHPKNAAEITESDLLQILELKPDIILIGTGEKSVILPAKKLTPLLEKQFHVECMNTAAACRVYTILVSEGRKVAAGLII